MSNRFMEKESTLEREDVPKPAGSLGDINSDTYNLYFKGLTREEISDQLAGFGVAIFTEEDDNLLFQMKGSLHDSITTVLEADLMALKLGLTQAVSLGIEHISIFCDRWEIYELVIGRSEPEYLSIALIMDDVRGIRQQFTSSIPVFVTENQTKFAYKLAMESISIRMTSRAQEKTCSICFSDEPLFSVALCPHQFCVECIKQRIELRLVAGGVPRCPHYSCKSNMDLKTCARLVTPKLKEIWEQRIKEDSIPVGDRFHCPNPRCWALMSKTELFESTTEDGVRRSCFKCRKPFCINCKVLWHSNLSCKEYKMLGQNPQIMSRRCEKCQHVIKLPHKTSNVTCRCGYKFCYTCGAQWKLGSGCRPHLRKFVKSIGIFLYILMIFSALVVVFFYPKSKHLDFSDTLFSFASFLEFFFLIIFQF